LVGIKNVALTLKRRQFRNHDMGSEFMADEVGCHVLDVLSLILSWELVALFY
jgi:hypothetical protein